MIGFVYEYSGGDVLVDPSLPVAGVASSINAVQVNYTQTISIAGRSSNLQFGVPYTWSTTTGFLEGAPRSRSLAAMGDARAQLSVNLWGAPSMDAAGFQALRASPRPIIGASVLVQIPTGGYDPDYLINVGANRWAIKPAIGVMIPVRPTWLLELDIGGWFFSDNDEFLGTTREQSPILSTEVHLVKRIRPGFWVAFDANFYAGGRSTVGGEPRGDLYRNSRMGATLTFPFRRRHAIRGSFSFGVVTKSGGDFRNVAIGYLYIWR
ncbi:MAG: transporter [Acidobacteriota bacterium]